MTPNDERRLLRLIGRITAAAALFVCILTTGDAQGSSTPPPIPATPREVAPQLIVSVSYWVDGVSTVAKLGSSLRIGRGRLDANVDLATGAISGDLTLPPAVGHFLSFQFLPVSSTTDFIPDGPSTGSYKAGVLDATTKVFIRLRDLSVNGTPLAAGSTCQTVTPAVLRVRGPLNLLGTSNFSTTYTIPTIAGCGTTEDLDPLIRAMISGPHNPLQLTLTFRCSGSGC
jgi:hypothetical protein